MYKFKDFKKHYLLFLEAKNINNAPLNIFSSNLRSSSINRRFYYPAIVSYFDDNIIVSVSPKYFKELKTLLEENKTNLKNQQNVIDILLIFFKTKIKDFQVKTMFRMVKFDDSNINSESVQILDDDTKELFMNTGDKADDKTFKEKKWQEIKYLTDSKCYFVYQIKNKIASMCSISNIDFSGGNLVVFTKEEHRNKGYAKKVLSKAIEWCFENNVLPIYFVDKDNISSLELAKSLNFKRMATEIVVSYTDNK